VFSNSQGTATSNAATLTVTVYVGAPVVLSMTPTTPNIINDSETTSHNVTMPAAIDSGDLLIVLFSNFIYGSPVTQPAGWSLMASDKYNPEGNGVRLSAYYKVADGSEGGQTFDFQTLAGEYAAAQVYRITNWNGHHLSGDFRSRNRI